MLAFSLSSGGSFSSAQFSSVAQSCLTLCDPMNASPPCPSPAPGVHSDSRPSSQWCHPAISSSAIPFSSCPQSLPASESFPMSHLFTWGGLMPSHECLFRSSLLSAMRLLSGKESACQCRRCRRHGFYPWVRKIPWRRKWQSIPVFFPRKLYGQRS